MKEESITLYFKEGTSDKVYAIALTRHGGGWVVNFQYGRRGSGQSSGTKTNSPVDYASAKKVYDNLVKKQKGKGYVEDSEGKPVISSPTGKIDTGIRLQLLTDIEEEDVDYYLNNPDYCMQEKQDGERRAVIVKEGVMGVNKKGQTTNLPHDVAIEISRLVSKPVTLDGEVFEDYIVLFDIVGPGRYRERLKKLQEMFADLTEQEARSIKISKTAFSTREKVAMYRQLVSDKAEGVVFKLIEGLYTAGLSDEQVKRKFYATASVVVSGINAKRSVSMSVVKDAKSMEPIEVGNVTIPPNKSIPNVGDVIEVRYLYYYSGGSLFQPTYLGVRADKVEDDCTLSKLKTKRELA